MILQEGIIAPDFELNATPDQRLRLSALRGKRVILAFYPADWSPVCGDQMVLFNATLRYFNSYNAYTIGISVDSAWSHLAFAENRNLHFPLLSDFEPKGAVSKLYGTYNRLKGYSERSLFIIDEGGVIRWSELYQEGLNPGVDGVLETLESMSVNKKYAI
ncbi:MAG TPA: redoxin domain-containing protein [Chryseolinea sp.]|nr:redoxin domain-containing protein [Chryseolinea sp.]